jgi:hypothetical protein
MGDARRQGNGIGNLGDEIKEKRKIRKLGKNNTHTSERDGRGLALHSDTREEETGTGAQGGRT